MEHCTPIINCLACGSDDLDSTLDLGAQPLANNFRKEVESQEARYPLAVNRCKNCNHLQLTHVVDPKLIYEHYLYVSGTSNTYVQYMDWYAGFVREYFTHGDWMRNVLDIGCNDGSQLNSFKQKWRSCTYGVDPAENLFPLSKIKHKVTCGYWNKETASKIKVKFDVITSQNAFSHIPNPLEYLELAAQYLTDKGKIFISTSQADMVLNGEFDTIYHEHISYYNATSMRELAYRAGLFLIDVVKTPIHGTSYIFVLSPKAMNTNRVDNIIAMEGVAGLNNPETYSKWGKNVQSRLVDIAASVAELQFQGYAVVGYGAAAKGMTLLNATNIHLDAVIDDNPLKQGTWCPGTDIPVVGSDYIKRIKDNQPVLFIPLAWNFYDEIKGKIKALRDKPQDRFMRYFPKVSLE